MFISEKTLKLKYFSDTETPLLWINHDAILFIKYSEHTKIHSYSFFFHYSFYVGFNSRHFSHFNSKDKEKQKEKKSKRQNICLTKTNSFL